MIKTKYSLILLVLLFVSATNYSPMKHLRVFDDLIGGVWKVEGGELGGQPFKQKLLFSKSLNGKLIETKVYSSKDSAWVLRGKGVRYFDKDKNDIIFQEWTIDGDVHEGTVSIQGDTLVYDYEYDNMSLQDLWIKRHRDTFDFVVQAVKAGRNPMVFARAKAVRISE